MKSSRLLPWFRSWSRRVPILHGILIAQLIMLPSSTSRGVWVDVDSDGDGIFDTGYDDGTTPPDTTPPPEPQPIIDSDGDNLSDADEAAAGSNPYSPDSDGDGITDADEVNLTGTSPTSADSNGNGVSDYNEFYGNTAVDEDTSGPGETPYDYDGDGIADPVDPDPLSPQNDPDSDGDYVPDSQDSDPYNPAIWNDANGNGINDDAEIPNNDTDGDGVSNDTDSHPTDPWLNNDWNCNGQNDGDEDADGDGVSNLQDSHPNSNCLWCDWNGNGVNDDVEAGTADSDGDNIADNADSHPFNNGLWEDWNSNGTNDSAESVNSDGDAQPDFSDSDPQDFNLWEDWNRNGINDGQEPPPNPDRDNDLMPNDSDSDPDNSALWCDWNRNGINDTEEPPPLDQDNDGHPDSNDSDPSNANLWEDWNHNGYNDSTEGQFLDDDNDSHPNAFDTHPQDATLWNDHNGNGINDENEITITDTDGDGYNDDLDTHPSNVNLWNDHNGNGINDELELPPDRDGDSIPDSQDEFPDDFDNDGLTDADELSRGSNPSSRDTDGDGLTDGEEVYAGTNLLHVDTDGDGLTDFEELRAYHSDPLTFTATGTNPPPTGPPLPTPTSGFYAGANFSTFWTSQPDLSDRDTDGIPNAIEDMYKPLIITPDGDLDGDHVSNLAEYNAGTNLCGTGSSSADSDGDRITDIKEDAWARVYSTGFNKYCYADAWEDPDGDGLLTYEELRGSFGTIYMAPSSGVNAGLCSNPARKATAYSNTANGNPWRTEYLPPSSAATASTSEFYLYRETCYAPWLTDGSVRLALAQASDSSGFFESATPIDPSIPYTVNYSCFHPTPGPDVYAGFDTLPRGYLSWLESNGWTPPAVPIGGVYTEYWLHNLLNHLNPSTNPATFPVPEEIDTTGAVIGNIVDHHPSLQACDTDIDNDGMPNAWEARYGLNWRNSADAGPSFNAIPLKPAKPEDMTNAYYLSSAPYLQWKNAFGIKDLDGDRLSNLLEYKMGLNPLLPDDFNIESYGDFDGDGYADGVELLNGSDPTVKTSIPPFSIEVLRGDNQSVQGGQWAAPLVVRVQQFGGNAFTDVTFTSSRGGLFRHAIFGDEGPTVTVSTAYNVSETSVLFQAPLTIGPVTITATVPSGDTAVFLLNVTTPGGGGGGGEPPNTDPNPVNFTLSWDAPWRNAVYTTGIATLHDDTISTVGWGSYLDSTLPPNTGGSGTSYLLSMIPLYDPATGQVRDDFELAASFEEAWAKTSYPSLNTPHPWGFGSMTTSSAYASKYPSADPGVKKGEFTVISLTTRRIRLRSDVILPQGHTIKCLVIQETSNHDEPAGTPPTVEVLKVIDCTIPPGMDVSQEINLKTASATPNTTVSIWLRPCDLFTDINNDGELTLADASLAAKAYTGSASDPETEKAVEYLFYDDDLSNGAWDREDPDAPPTVPDPHNPTGPPIPVGDDDAELLNAKPGITEGEAWFEHPAIAGISFYRDKGCTDKITELSGGTTMTFDLSTPAKNWPAAIYMRADGAITFDPADPQVEGDLVLMTKPKGAASAVEAARMKLTVVENFGATKLFQASSDYMFEQKLRHFLHRFSGHNEAYWVAMPQAYVYLKGINAHPLGLQSVEQVTGNPAHGGLTVVSNISYAGGSSPILTGGDGFYREHIGELYHQGSPDLSCSNYATSPFNNHLAQLPSGSTLPINFGPGNVPTSALEGSGGLLLGVSTDDNWTAFGQAVLTNGQKFLVVGCAKGASAAEVTFADGLAKGTSDHSFLRGDGGGSVALSVMRQDGSHKAYIKGWRHFAGGPQAGQCLRVYMGFQSQAP